MIGRDALIGCQPQIIALAEWLDFWGQVKKLQMIVSSGKRNNPTKKSWHNNGLAIDFYFKSYNIFRLTSELFEYYLANQGVWEGATEFEVCRGLDANGNWQNHIHIAFGTEKQKESFTGVY